MQRINRNQQNEIQHLDLVKPVIYNISDDYSVFRAGMDYRLAMKELGQTRGMIVEGSFSTAMAFYSWLKKIINLKHPVIDHPSSRKTKSIIYEKTKKILIKVKHHRIDLQKAPEIPWLKVLYPDQKEFVISLPDILGMNGAWQWYEKGVSYPMLEQSIHPFFGVYFPVRHGHLIMFDQWISANRGKFRFALDIGTGCGILGLIMANHGIEKIHATDINPNAVYSTSGEISRFNLESCFSVENSSFFGSAEKVEGLVVFNPPWIPGECMNMMDRGIYYEKGFFRKFFSEAEMKIAPGSFLVIIFSSFAIEARIADQNPIEQEILFNNNFMLEEKVTRNVAERSAIPAKNWINRIREKEKTELWVIKKL